MAKQEHLEILLSGVDAWNTWRTQDLQGEPDLKGAELIELDLSRANLRNANLSSAVLGKANLSGAILRGADLTWTDLRGADLSFADLREADLGSAKLEEANVSWTDLRAADLRGANIAGAYFIRTELTGADFLGASAGSTLFADVDLSAPKNIDQLCHGGPSIVDTRTLEQSGSLPDSFLQGVGFSDAFIEYYPSIYGGSAINLYSCFISYSHQDREFAKHLHDKLQGRGVRCWLDEHQILPGDDIRTEIDLGIRVWDKVLLCCSKTSLTASNWVDDEIEKALRKEQKLRRDTGRKLGALIPLNLDGFLFSDDYESGVRSELVRRNAADFTRWKDHDAFEAALDKVIKALRLDGGKSPAPAPRLGREP